MATLISLARGSGLSSCAAGKRAMASPSVELIRQAKPKMPSDPA
ncbi:hypothetical protein [Mycobacterium tilburgii]|nr:hypothetical protein [Mycobacterium tilburgii]